MAGKVFRHSAGSSELFFEVEKDDGELIRFDCRSSIPGGVILAFTKLGAAGQDATADERIAAGKGSIEVIKKLFRTAIVREQQTLFWSMVDGEADEGYIDMEQLMEIADHLAEAYAERPTGAPSSNGSPETSSGSPSTAGALHAVSTYSRSTPAVLSISSSTGVRSGTQ